MDALKPYLKAVSGFVTPGIVVLGSAVTRASDGRENITGSEWLAAVVACVVTGGVVWSVPNKPKRRDPVNPRKRILGKAVAAPRRPLR